MILINDYLFCLVARHVYGYTKVLDGDSDPERADHYVNPGNGLGPHQV